MNDSASLKTTILLTTIVVILLILFTIIKETILQGKAVDNSLLLLAVLPFIFYLVLSGYVSEVGGGSFWIKFSKALESRAIFEEEVPLDDEMVLKWSETFLRSEILPTIAATPQSTLRLERTNKESYESDTLKLYLEELTKFDFFKYVLFVDRGDVFNGYIDARSLLAQFADNQFLGRIDVVGLEEDLYSGVVPDMLKKELQEKGNPLSENVEITRVEENKWIIADEGKFFVVRENDGLSIHKEHERNKIIIEKINRWDLDSISGFRRHCVRDDHSNREILRILEGEKTADIAVVDKNMRFKGFTNREMITSRIVSNLVVKPE